MRCNTCLRECESVLTEIHREGNMALCAECAEHDPIAQAILSRPSPELRHPRGACSKCFYPIFDEACPLCGEALARQGSEG